MQGTHTRTGERLGSASLPAFGMACRSAAIKDRTTIMALWEYKIIGSGKGGFGSPSLLESQLPRYDAIWEESTDCLPATTIGL